MSRKIQFLQILRAVAAMLVVADHAILYISTKQEIPSFYERFSSFIGAFGVYIFFVISGFIMIYTSKSLFSDERGPLRFLSLRAKRIIPMYWVATIVAACLLGLHQLPSIQELVKSLFFIPYVKDSGLPLRPVLGVGWTLNLEMFFYVLFAVSLFFPRTIGITILLFTMVALVAFGSTLKPLGDTEEPVSILTFLTNPILLLFASGVLTGCFIDRWRGRSSLSTYSGYVSLVLVVLSVVVFAVLVDQYPMPIQWVSFFWIDCVIIVMLAAIAAQPKPSIFIATFEFLGNASYSIYLFHFIITAGVGRIWQKLIGDVGSIGFVSTAFIASCAIGSAIYLWIERPLGLIFHRPRARTISPLPANYKA